MKVNKLIIISMCIFLFGCAKEDVDPSKLNPTNRVIITINSLNVGDSINLSTGLYSRTLFYNRRFDKGTYLCNLLSGMRGVTYIGDCSSGKVDVLSTDVIHITYKGDVIIDYLPSSL